MKRPQSRTRDGNTFAIPKKDKDAGLFDEFTQVNPKKVENLGYEIGKALRQGINFGNRRKQGALIKSNVELKTKRAVESVKEKLQQQQQEKLQQQQHQQQQQQQQQHGEYVGEAFTNEQDETPDEFVPVDLDEFVSVDLSISQQPKTKDPQQQQQPPTATTSPSRDRSANLNYTLGAHAKYLHLGAEENGQYHYCDVSHLFLDDYHDLVEDTPSNNIKDYISPIPYPELEKLYFGLEPSSGQGSIHEPLPVRTLAIRIRPDVKSRIVMDAVQRALDDLDPSRCIILQNHDCHFRYAVRQSAAPFVIDSQLCTSRIEHQHNDSGYMGRYLVVRVFPIIDYTQVLVENDNNDDTAASAGAASDSQSKDPIPEEPFALNLHLKEASSLLQFLCKYDHADGMAVKADPPSCRMPSLRQTQKGTTNYFLQRSSYRESTNVRKASDTNNSASKNTTTSTTATREDMILPALSKEDWATLQSSSTVLQKIWESISCGNTAFHTMEYNEPQMLSKRLDDHYCLQLRQISRVVLLEHAKAAYEDLESQLQQIEESYFQFLHMLDDTYSRYELEKPEFIPRPSTTLELPVVQAHPPGFTMLAAVACSEENIQPDEAVQRVYAAFRQQDDQELEQGFQKHKQAQVTHRRQQIKLEQRKLLRQLEDPQIKTLCMAGKKFASLPQATNSMGRDRQYFAGAKVPLLEFSTSEGMCYVTASRILFVKTGIFCHANLFDYSVVEFTTSVCLKSKRRVVDIVLGDSDAVFQFRPHKIHPTRLVTFLQTLRILSFLS